MNDEKNTVEIKDINEELISFACVARCIAERIYNGIIDVGSGRKSADNVLHTFVSDMKDAEELYKRILELAKSIKGEAK